MGVSWWTAWGVPGGDVTEPDGAPPWHGVSEIEAPSHSQNSTKGPLRRASEGEVNMAAMLRILEFIGGAVVLLGIMVVVWIVKDVWKWSRSN